MSTLGDVQYIRVSIYIERLLSPKNRGVEGWVTTIFRLFHPTVPDKKCHFPVYFYTHLPIY